MKKITIILAAVILMVIFSGCSGKNVPGQPGDAVAEGLPKINIEGETDLKGNFFLSFVYSRNLIMLDGKGNIVYRHNGYTDGEEAELIETVRKITE